MLRTFILNADGSVSLSTEKPAAQSKLAEILEVLQRRTYAAEEVMRLISTEIARAKSNMEAQKNSSELQKHRQFLSSLYLVKDYVERTSAPDPFGQKFDRTELKNIEGEVFRFLKEVAFRDDRLMEVDVEQASRTKTFGEVSPKYMIELISDGMPIGSFKLLLWDGTQTFIQDHVGLKLKSGSDSGAIILEPPDLNPTVRQAICFPTRVTPFRSTRELFAEICALIMKFTNLSSELASLVGYTVLASWFPDCAPAPVCVSIIGARSCQRSNLFRLLSCLFRRSLVLGEISAAAICSLPTELCPALFLEQCELSPQLQKVLRASSGQDTYISWKGHLRSMCCAKVICNEEVFEHAALGQGAIGIPVTPVHRTLPILDKRTQQAIVEEFQPKLLSFRLEKYHQVLNSDFDFPYATSPVRDLARSLGACVPDAPDLQEGIYPLLKDVDDEWKAESECTTYLYKLVVEVLMLACHQKNQSSLHVGEIAARANEMLERRGEMQVMNAKRVGNMLRAIGIYPTRLDAAGRGILLAEPMRIRIHRLSWSYKALLMGILTDEMKAQCPECFRQCYDPQHPALPHDSM